MPKCPECKEDIDSLSAYSEVVQDASLGEDGTLELEEMDYLEGYSGFECPECHEGLFKTEKEALAFLKG